MQISLLLYKNNQKQNIKKKRNGKEEEGIIKCINHSTANKWANTLLQYRINEILNITA